MNKMDSFFVCQHVVTRCCVDGFGCLFVCWLSPCFPPRSRIRIHVTRFFSLGFAKSLLDWSDVGSSGASSTIFFFLFVVVKPSNSAATTDRPTDQTHTRTERDNDSLVCNRLARSCSCAPHTLCRFSHQQQPQSFKGKLVFTAGGNAQRNTHTHTHTHTNSTDTLVVLVVSTDSLLLCTDTHKGRPTQAHTPNQPTNQQRSSPTCRPK